MRAVICVPWRTDGSVRATLWSSLKPVHERRGYEVFEGDSGPGPFNRAEARNIAAESAGDWDVAAFIDADTFVDEATLAEAIALAHEHGTAVLPYTEFVSMNALTLEVRPRAPQGGANFPISGNVVVSRAAWEAVGGWDEAISGYGWEDGAFLKMLIGLGLLEQVPGRIAAYEHPRTEDEDPNRLLEMGKPTEARVYDALPLDLLARKVRARRAQRARVRAQGAPAREGATITA